MISDSDGPSSALGGGRLAYEPELADRMIASLEAKPGVFGRMIEISILERLSSRRECPRTLEEKKVSQ